MQAELTKTNNLSRVFLDKRKIVFIMNFQKWKKYAKNFVPYIFIYKKIMKRFKKKTRQFVPIISKC